MGSKPQNHLSSAGVRKGIRIRRRWDSVVRTALSLFECRHFYQSELRWSAVNSSSFVFWDCSYYRTTDSESFARPGANRYPSSISAHSRLEFVDFVGEPRFSSISL